MSKPPDSVAEGTGDRLLRPAEAAEMFRVTTGTLARWRREGLIARVRTPGGQYRYRLSDVQDTLEARNGRT